MKLNKIQSCVACFIISLFLILPINAQQWNGVGTSGNLWRLGNVGIGFPNTPTPTLLEKLQLNGAILLGNTANNNTGTIKWTGTDFEGRTSSLWLSLTGFGGKSGNNIYNTNAGNVGINDPAPTRRLSVGGAVSIKPNMQGYLEVGSYSPPSLSSFGLVLGSVDAGLQFNTVNGTTPPLGLPRVTILNDGKVGIGTTNPSHLLTVNGEIKAKKLIISLIGWADNVFNEGYQLMSLSEVEQTIKENKHLPGIPSEKEVLENGADIGEIQLKLLQKIEELTLYLIEQDKRIEMLEKENKNLLEKVNN